MAERLYIIGRFVSHPDGDGVELVAAFMTRRDAEDSLLHVQEVGGRYFVSEVEFFERPLCAPP